MKILIAATIEEDLMTIMNTIDTKEIQDMERAMVEGKEMILKGQWREIMKEGKEEDTKQLKELDKQIKLKKKKKEGKDKNSK